MKRRHEWGTRTHAAKSASWVGQPNKKCGAEKARALQFAHRPNTIQTLHGAAMNRRAFLRTCLATGLASAWRLDAQQNCVALPGAAGCEVKLPFPQVLLASTLQQCPEWCWAASLSMVFKFFGHPLDQKELVMSAYGSLACAPGSNSQIANDLSSSWTDEDGDDFTSAITAAYDYDAGVVAINNLIIINELQNGRPLLYCNSHHAMVVCGLDYRTNGAQLAVDRVYVMDPWPYAGITSVTQTVHPLSAAETVPAHLGGDMHFLASISVT